MALLVRASILFAEEIEADAFEQRLQALESQMLQLLEKKHETRFRILSDTSQLHTHLGPAASKIYFSSQEVELSLSSEFFSFQQNSDDRANVVNVAPVLSFRPHSKFIFNSQFLFENGGSESRNTITLQKGQSVVQMAYLDWLLNDSADSGIRVGHQLIPIGWINTRQEPVTHLSVLKPELETEIIPSTWHENGISFWMDQSKIDFQFGLFNSLDARGFRQDTLFSGGRSNGQNAVANDIMGVFRINAKSEWFLMGMSFAIGNSAQDHPALRNAGFRLAELHARLRWINLEIFGQSALAQLDDASVVSVYNQTTMGSRAEGNSIQASYNVLKRKQQLWVFARETHYNLHARMPYGFTADPSLKKQVTTIGASYFPLPTVVVKAGHTFRKNAAADEEDEFNLGVGVVF